MATQSEIASNIITQLRLLDPSVSAIIGTPERKIIDAVAQAIAGYQVDINMLNGAFDIDAKFGTDLDNMLGIFGFGRQKGTKSSGYVTFSTDVAKSAPIVISAGTQLLAPVASNGSDVIFITSRSVTLAANTKSIIAPVECIASGEFGNVAANTITAWNQTAITGIIGIANGSPTTGGADSESDEAMKARFKATGPFRNLAGTQDQYLALALSTFTTKASVIGPVSRYKEYIQVPSKPDSDGGNASAIDQYTTALSTNTSAKYVYSNMPFFVSDDTTGITIPYVQDVDYVANLTGDAKNKGDAYRNYVAVPSTGANPTSTSAPTKYQPNITFTNVYTGTDDTINLVSPKDVLLFEYSYLSSASRNDYERGVTNCVDVYVNGSDSTLSSTVIARPGSSISVRSFNDVDTNSALYYDNFRRIGEINRRPVVGNVFTPLLNQPIIDLPDTINTSNDTFIKGVHYWPVEDVTPLRGTIRARNGIEWSSTLRSKAASDSASGPFNGSYITDISAAQTSLRLDASVSLTLPYLFVESDATIPASGILEIDNEKIQFNQSSATSWSASTGYGYTATAAALTSTATGNFNVGSSKGFKSDGGHIIIDNEIIAYSGYSGSNIVITGRGQFGTTAASHTNSTPVSQYITYNGAAYETVAIVSSLPSTSPDINTSWIKVADILNVTNRAVNGTVAAKHTIGAAVKTPWSASDTVLSIENYIYDANIINLQAALEGSKQVTTDVLAHKAKIRYFKPDITVMYIAGSNATSVNGYIKTNLDSYFNSLYFGGTVQLSDMLQVIHNTSGVDNVRWSKDVLGSATKDSSGDPRNRLTETNANGSPINIVIEKLYIGDGITPTKYEMYFPNTSRTTLPSEISGSFNIKYGNNASVSVAYSNTSATLASNLQTAINTYGNVVNSITGSGTVADPFVITYVNKSDVAALTISNTQLLIGGSNVQNSDFLLQDDELASLPIGQTVDGALDLTSVMTIRVKAQNTWNQVNG